MTLTNLKCKILVLPSRRDVEFRVSLIVSVLFKPISFELANHKIIILEICIICMNYDRIPLA